VPKHLHHVHVGHGYKCEVTALAALSFGVAGGTLGGALGGAAGAVAGAAAGAIAGAIVDAAAVHAIEGKHFERHLHLDPEDIRKLGPSKSAKSLVSKRKHAMLKAHKKKK
jgi:hypothetical protein